MTFILSNTQFTAPEGVISGISTVIFFGIHNRGLVPWEETDQVGLLSGRQ